MSAQRANCPSQIAVRRRRKKSLLLLLLLLTDYQERLDADDEDDDDEDLFDHSMLLMLIKHNKLWSGHTRLTKMRPNRINFVEHVSRLRRQNRFSRMYRMSFNAFLVLVELLTPRFETVDNHHWKSGDYRIMPYLIVAIGIRYLAGGSYLDIATLFRISNSSFYRCVGIFVVAVNQCPQLEIKFPKTAEECHQQAIHFRSMSSEDVIRGCVGALDGCFIRIKAPGLKQAANVVAYYSGHYEDYGINVQASCNHRCQFNFVAIAAPASVGDARAIRKTSFPTKLNQLPPTYYVVADAAYCLSEKVLVPFTGSQRNDPVKDAFNYFLSQIRIRIEMSFGLLVGKWRILRSPIECSLVNTSDIILACCRLHNYVISMDSAENDVAPQIDPLPGAPIGLGYHPTFETPIYNLLQDEDDDDDDGFEEVVAIPGVSMMRSAILGYITGRALRRRVEQH